MKFLLGRQGHEENVENRGHRARVGQLARVARVENRGRQVNVASQDRKEKRETKVMPVHRGLLAPSHIPHCRRHRLSPPDST